MRKNEVKVIALIFEFEGGMSFDDQLIFSFFNECLPIKPLHIENSSVNLITIIFEADENSRHIFNDKLMEHLVSEYLKRGLPVNWTIGAGTGPALLAFDDAGNIIGATGKTVFDALARSGKGSRNIPSDIWGTFESNTILSKVKRLWRN